MPKREDIKKILFIGSGPIVVGQACEFDYSGSQACKALREDGYSVVLVNSNPATIMTDPEMADITYIEPLTVDILTKIIEKEKPDALLPTLGGQVASILQFFFQKKEFLRSMAWNLSVPTPMPLNAQKPANSLNKPCKKSEQWYRKAALRILFRKEWRSDYRSASPSFFGLPLL